MGVHPAQSEEEAACPSGEEEVLLVLLGNQAWVLVRTEGEVLQLGREEGLQSCLQGVHRIDAL